MFERNIFGVNPDDLEECDLDEITEQAKKVIEQESKSIDNKKPS
jgi:hypothetical protein